MKEMLESAWQKHRASMVPINTSDDQLRHIEAAFYSGVIAALMRAMEAAQNGSLDDLFDEPHETTTSNKANTKVCH